MVTGSMIILQWKEISIYLRKCILEHCPNGEVIWCEIHYYVPFRHPGEIIL